jgi:hypothetical protein
MRITFSIMFIRSLRVEQVVDYIHIVRLHHNNQSDRALFGYIKNFVLNDYHNTILGCVGEI